MMQQTYFVIDSFESLLDATLNSDFAPIYAELAGAGDLAPDAVAGRAHPDAAR
jgi:phenylalanine-4-hydroxylase